MIPLPTKGAKSLPKTEHLNFPPFSVNNLFKFSAKGRDLAPFIGNGTKVKVPNELKPPLSRDHFICIWLSDTMLYDSKMQTFQQITAQLGNVDCCALLWFVERLAEGRYFHCTVVWRCTREPKKKQMIWALFWRL